MLFDETGITNTNPSLVYQIRKSAMNKKKKRKNNANVFKPGWTTKKTNLFWLAFGLQPFFY